MQGHTQSFTQDVAGWTSNERQVLDLGDFSKHKRAHAEQAFDPLPPGGSLEIMAVRKPGQLFFELATICTLRVAEQPERGRFSRFR
jgi:hypothetical protein